MNNSAIVSYKTTIVGLILAGLLIVQEALKDGISPTDPELWIAVAIAVLGIVARDGDKSSQDHKIRPKGALEK